MEEKNVNMPKLGFIFKEKYGIDPSTLTMEEINRIIFDDRKPKVVNVPILEAVDCSDELKEFNKMMRRIG
jgi:hypothetical protein